MFHAGSHARGARPEAVVLSLRRQTLWRLPVLSLLTLAVLALGGCGGGGATRDAQVGDGGDLERYGVRGSSEFPVPAEIEPNVDFWRHVYGIWSRGQVAFHDDEHMGVIYEVARIPGAIHEGYTATQKTWVKERERLHRARVGDLEARVRAGATLTPGDRELLAKFEKAGGVHTLYGASERVRAQRGLRERFRRGVEISGRYDKVFRDIMRAHGVPEDLAYLPHVESSFQANARSSVGAAGVWQFMPATGKIFMDVNGAVDERLDPILAAEGAARYLSQAHARLHSWPLAVTSYNHGVGGMAKAKAQYGDDIGRIVKHYDGRAFGFASRNFYAELVAAREVASNAKRYFPEGVRYESPWPHDRLVLRSAMPAHHIARHYGVSTTQLADLNMHWRDGARSGRTHLPGGSNVWLPAGSMQRVASHPPAYSDSVMIARSKPDADRGARLAQADASRSLAARPAVEQSAPQPEPRRAAAPVSVARTTPKPTTRTPAGPTTMKVAYSPKPAPVVAKSVAKTPAPVVTKPVAAKKPTPSESQPKTSAKTKPAKAKPKHHVVKPKETLYRVATENGISVAELRKLNNMGPNDNHIQPGQKLKVGGS